MRVDLKKYLFIGLEQNRELFFEKAQELGIIHFIDPQSGPRAEWPVEFQNITAAIKILRSQPVVEQEESTAYTLVDGIVNEILAVEQQIEKCAEDLRMLSLEIARVAPLGDYDSESIAYIEREGRRVIQFFCAKEGMAEKNGWPEDLIYINTQNGLDYFISLSPHPVQYEKMIEIIPEAPLAQLKARLALLTQEMHAKELLLKQYARYNEYLHHALIYKFNTDNRLRVANFAASNLDDMLFAIEGWVPVDSIPALSTLTASHDLHVEEVATLPTDIVPTCLKNEGLARIGEDLVHIYDTPAATDKDPSLWVLGFFALFFAMIIGDAGYGLILLLAGVYFQRKQKKISAVGKRFFTLLYLLSGCIIVWGVLNTSFFGMSVPLDSPVRKLSLLTWLAEKKAAYHFAAGDATAKEALELFPQLAGMQSGAEILKSAVVVDKATGHTTNAMYDTFANHISMELALFIGIFHIILSLLRYLNRHISHLGWIVALIGGYLFIPSFLDATSMSQYLLGISPEVAAKNGLWLIYGGLGFALVASFFEHGFLGPVETLNRLIQLFSDSMSYLRLYALGLSGALVTNTINELAGSLNVVFATGLFIVGHLVNLALGIMGGVIHGLRLNFLEWYHYSFEGDGKRFDPLQKIEIE